MRKGKGSATDAKILLIKGLQEVLVSLGATFSYIHLENTKSFLRVPLTKRFLKYFTCIKHISNFANSL